MKVRIEAVGDDAALMEGRIQFTGPAGDLTDRSAVWLSLVRDGLIWRTGIFDSVAEARAGYAELSRQRNGRPGEG